jgi:hypothetical protein
MEIIYFFKNGSFNLPLDLKQHTGKLYLIKEGPWQKNFLRAAVHLNIKNMNDFKCRLL